MNRVPPAIDPQKADFRRADGARPERFLTQRVATSKSAQSRHSLGTVNLGWSQTRQTPQPRGTLYSQVRAQCVLVHRRAGPAGNDLAARQHDVVVGEGLREVVVLLNQ